MSGQGPEQIRGDLPPDLEAGEGRSLVALGVRLAAERPAPDPSFRGNLRRRLADPGGEGSVRPRSAETVRLLVASYVASGLLLLAVAATGLAGAGPFAAG